MSCSKLTSFLWEGSIYATNGFTEKCAKFKHRDTSFGWLQKEFVSIFFIFFFSLLRIVDMLIQVLIRYTAPIWGLLLFTGCLYEGECMTVGVILPHTNFATRIRAYHRQLNSTRSQLAKNRDSTYLQLWNNLDFESVLWPLVPPPDEILRTLCYNFLQKNVSVIIYVTDAEFYNRDVAAAQYFMQLSNYIGLPVIAWNAANVGLEKRFSNSVILQLAPTLAHQAEAMLAIMIRYEWRQFCLITSSIIGREEFIQGIEDSVENYTSSIYGLKLEMIFKMSVDVEEIEKQLSLIVSQKPSCRVFLMYVTHLEARKIFIAAKSIGLTRREFVWIVPQSVIGLRNDYTPEFPVGLLGVHFDTAQNGVLKACENAVRVLENGFYKYFKTVGLDDLNSNLSCKQLLANKWTQGMHLHRQMKSIRFSAYNEDTLEFSQEGTLKQTTLEIINLDTERQWRTVGFWKDKFLVINDITWPGGSHVPPLGKPEKFHLKVTFLEEPPYLIMEAPDPETGKCRTLSADICTIPAVYEGVDVTGVGANMSYTKCCSGYCVDLLQKLSRDLDFSYDLSRVPDGRWGSQTNGKWNGLIAELIEKKTDMVMTSLKINSERESAVSFSVPFLETGIAVIVAKKNGVTSPHAFLQPFDPVTWFTITVISIQAGALSIFIFEWLSPVGLNRKKILPKNHNFTLFQTYWLSWAMLFKAPVRTVGPKGSTSKFMANVWAAFAVVFIAIYTANLAVFMITRELYYDFVGVNDTRLIYPHTHIPPFKYGTIPFGNTETVLKGKFPEMYKHMKPYNRSTVIEGINAVKLGELDAFIYDATVLDHLSAQDDDCRLLTVGNWYSMTGYGVAFPKKSQYRDLFNHQLLAYRQSGELEQWQKFWLGGACKPKQEDSSDQLQGFGYQAISFKQFISAFVLLGLGMFLGFIVFIFEHCYSCYVTKVVHRRKSPKSYSSWWGLVSLNISRSLNLTNAECKNNKCGNLKCDVEMWKLKRELDLIRIRAEVAEAKIEQVKRQFIQGTFL